MNRFGLVIVTAFLGFCASAVFALDEPFFHSTDPLAARDEWGLLTQGPLNETDFAPRYHSRWTYYVQSSRGLSSNPGYVGALQAALRRKGYYLGPIDGLFSSELSDSIARMQKAYAMRVTGTLTVPVRRALHLP